ncbi:5'/3'-nucleotidase SurE [Lentzea alba]|uniref:5'/3'-nucleotidase SurE n=1 Tax=Lentzea alba TaxID=2714351 RepID=UPI0039BF5283
MRALITNDDGIDSPGLLALARAAAGLGWEVLIAAPSTEASGTGTSLASTEGRSRIRLERRDLDGFEAYAVPAHPGLISFLACHEGFGARPDVVLSGVNYGANTGNGILHSGTVGAALTAGVRGVSALAVSLDIGWNGSEPLSEPLWVKATEVTRVVLPTLLEMPTGTVLNLNVPNGEVRGLEWADIAPASPIQVRVERVDDLELKLSAFDSGLEAVPGTEVALLARGFATLTPLSSVERATPELPSLAWPG